MAIIYTYPEINQVEGEDLLLISDTSLYKRPTRSVTIDNLAAYIGSVVGVVQNLQSVLTVGNTYVSPDGYGTFTLNDIANNDGSIKFANTDEGWGYQISAEEGFNITDGHETNLMSIYSSGLSIRNGAQIMNIGTNALTATRNVYFPDASGTIALENVSEWYNVTGSRGLGNLLVKIGDYDNSGNGTFLSIDDADQSIIFTKGGVVESKFVFAATQDRDYTFPNADGTIALTSDIPAPGPSGSGTANYTARWTNASTLGIGALYDNGTNVGIGTANPTQKLEVNGTVLLSTLPNNNGRLCLGSVSTNLFSNAASGHLYVSTNASTRMTILNNGNVGIGTTSPSEKLEVSNSGSNGSVNENLLINMPSTSNYVSGTGSIIGFKGLSQYFGALGGYTNGVPGLGFWNGTNTGAPSMVLISGNVGVGTTSPSEKLHVFDTAVVVKIEGNGVTSANLKFKTNETDRWNLNVPSGSTDLRFTTGSSDTLTLKSSGNVGIGTTSPTHKLEVVGDSNDTMRVYRPGNRTLLNIDADAGRTSALAIDIAGTTQYYVGMPTQAVSGLGARFAISYKGAPSFVLEGSSGNIGIGTTGPNAKLEVNGDINIGTILPTVGALSNKLNFWGYTAGQGVCASIGSYRGNNYVSGGLIFETGELTTSEKMRITPTGNVGIGTTNPQGKLDISTTTSSDIFNLRIHNLTGEVSQSTGILFNTGYTDVSRGKGGLVYEYDTSAGWNRGDFHFLQRQDGASGVARLSDSVLTIKNNGNVGIGTTSPLNKLQVTSGSVGIDSQYMIRDNRNNTILLQSASTAASNRSLTIGNATYSNIIVPNGNVGIGTTNPGSTLPADSEAASKVLQLTGVSGSTGDTAVLLRSSDNSSGLDLWHNASTGDSYIDNRYNSNQGDTIFRVKTAGTPLEALRITGDGNVGIGTTSPGAKLDVNGTTFLRSVALDTIFGQSGNNIAFINTGNTTFNNSNVGIGTTNPNTKLHIKENGYGFKLEGLTDGRYIRMTGSGSDAYIDSQGQNFLVLNNSGNGVKVLSGSSNTRLIIGSDSVSLQSQNDTLKFLTSSSEAMRITSDGKLGIGTTNPLAKLQVSSTSGWGVFTERGIKDGSTSTYSHSYGAGNAHVLGRATIFESTVTFSTLTADAQTKEYRLQNSSNKLVLASVVAGITTENNILVASGTNIGIGTNSPSEKLEVAGGGRFEGMTVKGTNSSYWLYDRDLTNRGQESFRITRNVGSVTFYDRTYSGGYEELDFLKFNHSTSGSSVLSLKSKTTIDFLINQSNVARINSAGNVGIGTTNPTAKLDVNGDIRIKGENQLYLGGATSVPNWEITASGSDLIVNDTGTNVGSVLFNNDEGVALPRLTTTEINAISSPTQGLMAYNTTLNTICFYNGSSWQKVSHTSM